MFDFGKDRLCLALLVAVQLLGPATVSGQGSTAKGPDQVVHMALGAGRWFPADRRKLADLVDRYMAEARVPRINGTIVGAIAPHAGYLYSGKVAGYTFRAIKDQAARQGGPEVVVILGFSHRGRFRGVALMDGAAIETPLGKALLHEEAARMLADQSPLIYLDYRTHMGEHSAENEIPFIQRALPGTRLIIALMGNHDSNTVNDLVKALYIISRRMKTLVIASTDMLHDPDYDLVGSTDRATLRKIEAMDYTALMEAWSYSRQILCGIGPVLAVIGFSELKGCKRGTVLKYRNSGDDFPESRGRWVVGYGSVVFALPGNCKSGYERK